jgi:hypothetical protein
MSKSSEDVHRLFMGGFGTDAAVALVQCAVQAHEVSRSCVRKLGFPSAQARDVLPYLRRAEFETRASGIVVAGVRVETRRNQRGTSSFVELSSNGAVVTALTRTRPPTRLPAACYRNSRAEASQMTIFELLAPDAFAGNDNDPVYGCFIYGGPRDSGDPTALTMARVYFPLPDLPLLAIPPLDLLREYSAIVDVERERAASMRPSEELAEVAMQLKAKLDVSIP